MPRGSEGWIYCGIVLRSTTAPPLAQPLGQDTSSMAPGNRYFRRAGCFEIEMNISEGLDVLRTNNTSFGLMLWEILMNTSVGLNVVRSILKRFRIQEALNLSMCADSSSDTIKIMTDVSCMTCHMSHVMCRVSCVTCPMSLTATATPMDPPPTNSPTVHSKD